MDNPVSNEYRQVPQDGDAERAVLGSIFFAVKSENAMVEASAILVPEDFNKLANQTIFKAMQALVDENRPIDMLTVQDKLNSMHQLENVGGMAYLAEISESTASSANLKHYANIVREKSVLRKMIDTLMRTMSLAYDAAEPSEDLLAQLSRSIDTIAENRGDENFRKIKDVLQEYQANLDEAVKNDSDVVGLSTGYPEMDKITHGFRNDQMIVFGARPAVGKTAFVLNIARNVAKNEKVPVVIFEMEMSATDIVGRLLAGEGSIDSNHLTTGQMTQEDWQALTLAMQSLAQMKIYMDDTAGIKINQISAKLHQLERDLLSDMTQEERIQNPHPIGMVVIDYLGLIESNNSESRQQAVSEVSRAIKKMAKELNTPIIALAQLSRGVEQRTDKRPVLSDLRDSGSIEQDADVVAFLYRDDYSRGDSEDGDGDPREEQEAVPIEIIFEKNRAGARGTATLMFNKPTFKFNAMAPLYRNDMNAGAPDVSPGW
ncbi:MAG: replicative DNA helicase [Leuconostoc mesenteroides]